MISPTMKHLREGIAKAFWELSSIEGATEGQYEKGGVH
jgi:hypothetical protein